VVKEEDISSPVIEERKQKKETKTSKAHLDHIFNDIDFESTCLVENEKKKLKNMVSNYADIFSSPYNKLGRYTKIKHEIKLTTERPFQQKLRRQSPATQESIRKQVGEMLKDGIISESQSPYASNVVIVKKRSGEPRFCTDFRHLNAITVKDSYPMSNPADIFNTIGVKKPSIFSTLDTSSGFWQISMEDSSKKYTAFRTADGLYEYNVLSFGLVNSPSTFCRVMNEVLRGLQWNWLLV
jgi:hypothetical protein